jgi:hypothetical protein
VRFVSALPTYGVDPGALAAGFAMALSVGLLVAAPYAVWSIFRRLTD